MHNIPLTHSTTHLPTYLYTHITISPPHITTDTLQVRFVCKWLVYIPPHSICMNLTLVHETRESYVCWCAHELVCSNQYLLLWLRGRDSGEFPGLGRWRFSSLCLRMEGGVTGVELVVFIHWELGERDSPLTSESPVLSLSAGESSGSQPLEPHWIAAAAVSELAPSP